MLRRPMRTCRGFRRSYNDVPSARDSKMRTLCLLLLACALAGCATYPDTVIGPGPASDSEAEPARR
jgi:hypothetical protein